MVVSQEAAGSGGATALLSAAAGRAIVRTDSDSFFLIRTGAAPEPCDAVLWPHLRALHPDAEFCPAGTYPFDELRERLVQGWKRERALSLTLIALDAEHDGDLRFRACAVCNALLSTPAVVAHVRERLLAVAPPDNADFLGAEMIARMGRAHVLLEILQGVTSTAQLSDAIRRAWVEALRALPDPDDRLRATSACEEQQIISHLVDACGYGPWDNSLIVGAVGVAISQASTSGKTVDVTQYVATARKRPPAVRHDPAERQFRASVNVPIGGSRHTPARITVKGMVQVLGHTYRMDRVAPEQYDVVRILDDLRMGSFTIHQGRIEVAAQDSDFEVVKAIAQAAVPSSQVEPVQVEPGVSGRRSS